MNQHQKYWLNAFNSSLQTSFEARSSLALPSLVPLSLKETCSAGQVRARRELAWG